MPVGRSIEHGRADLFLWNPAVQGRLAGELWARAMGNLELAAAAFDVANRDSKSRRGGDERHTTQATAGAQTLAN